MRRGIKVRLVAFVMLSVMGILYVGANYLGFVDQVLGRGYTVHVMLPDSGGLYEGIEAPRIEVGFSEAEFIKFVNNSFHAMKVVFANEIGRLCLAMGVDPQTVMDTVVADNFYTVADICTPEYADACAKAGIS